MVELEGTYTFAAPQDVVWAALLDPQVLAQAMPGTEELVQTGENQYRGVMNVRVGPVQGKFEGNVILTEVVEPERFHLAVNGRGAAGYLDGQGDLRLEAQVGQTVLHYTGQAQVGGRIASVGQRLIDSTARSLTRQALESLDAQIQARLQGEAAPEAAEAPAGEAATPPGYRPARYEPPSTAQVAARVARDVAADMIPEEQRPLVVAGLVALIALLVLWLLRRED